MKLSTREISTKTYYSGISTVYGGNDGIKLYLKTEIISTIHTYEDSGYEIQSISIQQLHINK